MFKVFSFLLTFFFLNIHAQVFPYWKVQLIKHLKPDTYFAGCWGWYDPVKNREYAISTSKKGTWFVDITNPQNAYIADSVIGIPINTWREVKNYKHYCYIISDDYLNTFQIVDMSYLPDSVHVIASPHLGVLRKGHTLWVDGHYLYVGGPTDNTGTLRNMGVFNLHPDPKNPQFLRWLSDDYPSINYVHDMFVRNDTVYASAGFQGLFVYKYDTLLNKFFQLGSFTSYLDNGYNHSSALTKDGKTLVFMDEVPAGLSIKITDVSNLSNIQVLNYLKPYNYSGFIAHNPFILGNNYLIASCYQDGTLIYDISNPSNPVLKGFFDTYPQGGAHQGGAYMSGYNGNWGSYPFFPSGLILSNDMKNGIFILKADSAFMSVKENQKNIPSDIAYFPNPVHDKLHITLNADELSQIRANDILGTTVVNLNFQSSPFGTSVDFPDLPGGIYFLSLQKKDRTQYRIKIVHEK
ncbi:MAG: choice-of-anchor B family protein [Bacteroidia bacterium]|nr:choice-of-anchor B family protein [Bacteroidia bacterium]